MKKQNGGIVTSEFSGSEFLTQATATNSNAPHKCSTWNRVRALLGARLRKCGKSFECGILFENWAAPAVKLAKGKGNRTKIPTLETPQSWGTRKFKPASKGVPPACPTCFRAPLSIEYSHIDSMDARTSTCDLVERFKRGEPVAFSLLFRRYQRRLAVIVYYKMSEELRRRVEVDDIVQEVFFAASQAMNRFTYQSPGSLVAWLTTIAERVIVDTVRHENREKRRPEQLVRLRSESNPGGPEPLDFETPSRVFARQESVQNLLRKMDALPAEYREIILLAKFEGLTTAEISERLGKSREGVALVLHRGLKRFREIQAGVNKL